MKSNILLILLTKIIIFIYCLKEFILFNSKYFQLMKGKKYISECFETTDLGFETEFNNIKPKVSVIIPVFNCQNTIRSSIISIQKQTLKEIEIILVNDFSLDGSKEIIENIQKDDPRIVIIISLIIAKIWELYIPEILGLF